MVSWHIFSCLNIVFSTLAQLVLLTIKYKMDGILKRRVDLLPMIFHLKWWFTFFFTPHVFCLISFVCLHFRGASVGCAKVLIIFKFRLSMGLPMWWNSIVEKELKCFFFSSNLHEFLFGLKITHTRLSDMIMVSEWLIIYHYLNLQSCNKYLPLI